MWILYGRYIKELSTRDCYPVKEHVTLTFLGNKQKSRHDRQSAGARPGPGDL